MNATIILVAGLVLYLLGYALYARFLAKRIFKLDPEAPVPSKTMEDGVDYIPTNRYVLFGHHFSSIAGAAPIVGPALAVIWGWVPALLWVVLGAVLMGCVHDMSALVLSVRHKARSIGDIAGDLIGKKAVTAYMIIMFFVVVLLMAIFLRLIAWLLQQYPEVVFPAAALVVIALGIGLLMYRTRIGLLPASIVGIVLMLASIWWGTDHPFSLQDQALEFNQIQLGFTAMGGWILLLAAYAFVASVLPVWLLLQPRDYLESFKLYAGLGLLFAGIIVAQPTIVAPPVRLTGVTEVLFTIGTEFQDDLDSGTVSEALRGEFKSHEIDLTEGAAISTEETGKKWNAKELGSSYAIVRQDDSLDVYAPEAPPIWPFLFVTIACGALTGFHAIVASGTTSKQLANEKDAAFVGYGGMAAESALALCAVIACTAGFVTVDGLPDADAWWAHYGSWGNAGGLGEKVGAFVDGSTYFVSQLGIPSDLAKTFMGLMIVAFALTTLDSACRLGRYVLAEFGKQHRMPFLKDAYLGSAIAAGLALLLAVMPGLEANKSVGQLLWPLFGTTNQLLAALVFATVTIYLVKRRTRHWFISIPLVFVAVTTVAAMIWNIWSYVEQRNWILTVIGSVILLAGLFLIAMSCGSYVRAQKENRPESDPVEAT